MQETEIERNAKRIGWRKEARAEDLGFKLLHSMFSYIKMTGKSHVYLS